jgi:calcium-dependent protein kinase
MGCCKSTGAKKPTQGPAHIQYKYKVKPEPLNRQPEDFTLESLKPSLPSEPAEVIKLGDNDIKHSVADVRIIASNFVRLETGGLSTDYVLGDELGQGGFAVVNKALHIPTGQTRAVKTIHKAGLTYEQIDPKYQLREFNVLRSLDHPNILRCYEIFEDSSRYYIVTEMCSGGELFDTIVKHQMLTEAQAAKVMHQLLSCVAYCHSKQVIHRDLKPENILLEDSEDSFNVKIADFGSTAFIDLNRRISGNFGSAYYVAPEVIEGRSYDERCDLWSCGIILFIMLTGRPPYQGSSEIMILENMRRKPFDPASYTFDSSVSSEAKDLMTKLLRIDFRERISAAEAVSHPWVQQHRNSSNSVRLFQALQNLRGFNAASKLKDAVFTFLATNAIAKDELKILRESFQEVDTNSDGRLSQDELLMLYLRYTNKTQAKAAVKQILDEVDSDRSGFIDYSEFLRACMDHEKVVSKANLQLAFNKFDVDGSGLISAEELKEVLSGGEAFSGEVWKQLIQEVDINGDGVLDLKEFTQLMLSKV